MSETRRSRSLSHLRLDRGSVLSKRGYAHILSMNQLIFVFFLIFLTLNSTRQLGSDLAFGFVNKRSGYEIRDFIDLRARGEGVVCSRMLSSKDACVA